MRRMGVYDEIRDVWRLERTSYRIQKLPSDLYERAREHIATLKAKLSEEPSSLSFLVAKEEMEVLRSLLKELFTLRIYKAMLLTLEGYKVLEQLAVEERVVVESAIESLSRGITNFLSSLELAREVEKVLIRFIKSAPKIILEGLEYGPFNEEELAYLPSKLAQQYVKDGLAVEIQ